MALNRELHGLYGVGQAAAMASKTHKIICQALLFSLADEIDTDEYELFQEWCIDASNLNSEAPDTVIFEQGIDTACFIIEVTTSKEYKKACDKIESLIELYPTVKEAFVYDYEKKRWYCVGEELEKETPSYSEMFDIDLNDMIE